MTAEEAIKLINHICEGCKDLKLDTCDECVYPLAIKALEKQIPKKPITNVSENDFPDILYMCPCCKAVHNKIDKGCMKYCCECSQKFDWSEEE